MTTSHKGESEDEVAFFFVFNTNFDVHDFKRYLVVAVGCDDRSVNRLWLAVVMQAASAAQSPSAYVPNQALLSGCSPYTRSNLGCNTYSDGTVTSADSVAHEFMEAVTDPLITTWYDKQKAEIADKCNFDYQACVALPNGTSWQIQSEWSNTLGGCQQQ